MPGWFVHLLGVPEIGASYPVTIEGKRVGDIVFAPDMSADIYEKWIGFLAIASSGIALMLLTGVITHFTARSALGPLQNLGDGLTRMRMGDYEHLIPATGPPEIRKSSLEANELARTLSRLSQDNRSLLRRIVSLQDDERRDMARELHDELGPLLFGIRANTVALLEAIPPDKAELGSAAEGILQSVETLQQANRRILDRLRPLYIQELGLERSIQTLLQNAKAQAPDLAADVADRRQAERDRWPVVADGLSRDPGGGDQRAPSRQGGFDACSGRDRGARTGRRNIRQWHWLSGRSGVGPGIDWDAGAGSCAERNVAIAARGGTHLRPLPPAGRRFRRGCGNEGSLTRVLAADVPLVRPADVPSSGLHRPRRQLPAASRAKQGRKRSAGFFRPA